MLLQENTMFANRYQLERLLGRGGFSEVWLAKDSYTKLDIVIKVYAPGQGMDSDGLAEFSSELAGVFNLNHTNLLRPTHVDAWEGMPYLIMPYCSRGSMVKQVGKMQENEIWELIHDVASGLAYLHQNDIVHQDIKPDNILLDDSGNYVITDFGISTKARSTLRKSVIGGAVSGGTMAYMGPERFSKQPAPTKASDIWSFGAMLYELITGNVPFGEMGGGMQKGGAEIPEINEPISDKLRLTIESMLALETWDRPTAEQLADRNINIPNTEKTDSKVAPISETSSRATQRFVPASSTETVIQTQRHKKVDTESNENKKWRWLPILESILLAPFLLHTSLLSSRAIYFWMRDGYLCGFLVIILGLMLCLILYFWLLNMSITENTQQKKWISGILVCFILTDIGIELIWRSGHTIAFLIYIVICLCLWFAFQSRIPELPGDNKRRKTFYIVLCVFYILVGGFLGLGGELVSHELSSSSNQTITEQDITREQYNTKIEGEKFLLNNAKRSEVVCTHSGLQYEVIKQGRGPKPTPESYVVVHYEGTLIDGTIFDSSYQRGEPIEFPLNGVIKGWTEGLQLMPVGSIYKFYIPYELAYGERGAGESIPPYSALIFTIELLQIEEAAIEIEDF